MLSMAFLFHANLLYAEYPFERIPEIVEKSYLPVLEALLSVRTVKAVFNFSGFSLELIAGEHPELYQGKPELFALLAEGVRRGQIELSGTSWGHTVLPTLPVRLQELDIGLFLKTAERLTGARPQGFFPPELGISPLLPELLAAAGYRWSVIDRELAASSGNGFLNDYNDFVKRSGSFTKLTALAQKGGLVAKLKTVAAMKRILTRATDFSPIEWQGTGSAALTAFPLESAWIAHSLLSLSRRFLYREKKLVKRLRRAQTRIKGFLFPYSSDIEFFGLGGNTLPAPIPIPRLIAFFSLLEKEGLEFSLPSDYLANRHFQARPHYCKAGSWSTDKDFALWTHDADNRALDQLCREAWEAFGRKEETLAPGKREEVVKDLLLAFNSDGRGWTPLPEHRLFCFNKAKRVLDDLSGR